MRGKLISLFLLLALCIMAQTPATSPDVTITGRFVNDANEPLAGAHVWLVQLGDTLKKHGTTTDADGKFTRSVPREKYELRVSYIGCVGHTS